MRGISSKEKFLGVQMNHLVLLGILLLSAAWMLRVLVVLITWCWNRWCRL
jgi:hypothetical protein